MIYAQNGTRYDIRTTEQQRREITSLHGLIRVIDRANLNEKKSISMIRKAWERGLTADQMPRRSQREYILRHTGQTKDAQSELRVYQDMLFIFASSGMLITAYPLPKKLFTVRHYDMHGRVVRNIKKYQRMTMPVQMEN